MTIEVMRVAEPVGCRPTVASMTTDLNAGSSPGSPPVEGVIPSTGSSGRHLDKRRGLEGAGWRKHRLVLPFPTPSYILDPGLLSSSLLLLRLLFFRARNLNRQVQKVGSSSAVAG